MRQSDARAKDPPNTDRLPKVELHVHIEGSLRPELLVELAHRNGLALPTYDPDELAKRVRVHTFEEFIAVWDTITPCLVTPEDFGLVAHDLLARAAGQGVIYSELRINPKGNLLRNGPFGEVLREISWAMDDARRQWGIESGLVIAISRHRPIDEARQVTQLALDYHGRGVVGLDLSGDEKQGPAPLFAEFIAQAHQSGLPVTIHAGEWAAPQSVWDAVRVLGTRRIGHGIKSIGDAALLQVLRDEGVHLEVCPTSNVCTGAVPSLEAHPVRRLFEMGISLSVNSDDPLIFGTDVGQEYALLANRFGFSADELRQLTLNGIEAAFVDEATRARLRKAALEPT